jgi:hypothetical protein
VRGDVMTAPGFGALLVCIGAVQVIAYVVVHGRPSSAIRWRALRLPVANAGVIAGGGLAYRLLADALDLTPATIGAVGGAVVAAGLLVGMLFEGWLGARLALIAVVAVAALVYTGLEALAHAAGWTRAAPEEWTAYAGLNAIGAGVILHVAIGRRWPFAASAATPG